MNKTNMWLGGIVLLLSACTGKAVAPRGIPTPTPTSFPAIIFSTAAWTETPLPTSTASPVPTPQWIVAGPGDVTVPILLYHHIGTSKTDHRYYVSPEQFEAEIKALQAWGYSTITLKMLVQAITQGCELPPHPIMITFDDGHMDVYANAFPIMKKYGFTGTIYIVGNYMGAAGFMDRAQILELYDAGWDVGSHSMRHLDLTKLSDKDLRIEIMGSKAKLEDRLGIEIISFAYPFGTKNNTILGWVRSAGYAAAMGAEGYTDNQGKWNLFDLQRVEIRGTEDIQSLSRFLTWKSYP
jgi:peptidoglycan/xylan/chitin deacetylase (PgdA/CDA1 family)